MKDRMTLGHNADAAETAALTLVDRYATDRIIAALDWEHDSRVVQAQERRRKERDRKRRSRAICKVRDVLGPACAEALNAWLNGRTWRDIGVPERTFWDRLKKVKIFFQPHE